MAPAPIQEAIKIVASLYDAGGKLLGSDFSFAELAIVRPGQRAPFSIVVLKPPAGLSRHALKLEARPTARQPIDQFAMLSSGDRAAGSPGSRYIFGELRNDTGANIQLVKVVATLYDARGAVVQADFAYADIRTLAPGQTAPFEIAVQDWNNATRYQLQAQGLKE